MSRTVLDVYKAGDFITLKGAQKVLMSIWSAANVTQPWEGLDVALVPLLVGDPGIGKTSMIHHTAAAMGADFCCHHIGALMQEDELGLPMINHETGRTEYAAPEWFPIDKPKGKFGVFLHDEALTADPDKQNQLRQMISEYRVGGLKIANGWFQVATANPPESRFTTVKVMDHAIEDRLLVLPVRADFEDFMRFSWQEEKLPESIYLFLRFSGATVWQKGSPRKWCSLGNVISRLTAAEVDINDISRVFAAAIDSPTAQIFSDFLSCGHNEIAWPIIGEKLFDTKRRAANMKILKEWSTSGKDRDRELMIATSYELQSRLSVPGLRVKKDLAEALVDYLCLMPRDRCVSTMVELTAANINFSLVSALRKLMQKTKCWEWVKDIVRKDQSL